MARSFVVNFVRQLSQLRPHVLKNQSRLFSTSPKCFTNDEEAKSEDVVIERLDEFKIMSIGINRPKKRNCVNKETAEQLYEAFNNFDADDTMNCAVLHGIGGNFCAGYDLSELANLDKDNIANTIVSVIPVFSIPLQFC